MPRAAGARCSLVLPSAAHIYSSRWGLPCVHSCSSSPPHFASPSPHRRSSPRPRRRHPPPPSARRRVDHLACQRRRDPAQHAHHLLRPGLRLRWHGTRSAASSTGRRPGTASSVRARRFTRNSSTLNAGSHTINLLLTGNNFRQTTVQITIWIGPPPTDTRHQHADRDAHQHADRNSHRDADATNTPLPPTNTPVPPTNTPVPPTTRRCRRRRRTRRYRQRRRTRRRRRRRQHAGAADEDQHAVGRTPRPSTVAPAPTSTAMAASAGPISNSSSAPSITTPHDPRFDLNGNGRVGWGDVWETIRQLGRRCDGTLPATATPAPPTATRTPTASPVADEPTATPTDALLPD